MGPMFIVGVEAQTERVALKRCCAGLPVGWDRVRSGRAWLAAALAHLG